MGAAPILTILRNGETVKSQPIEGEAVLGRSEGCVIRLEDRAISRQHVVFRPVPEGVQVEKKSEFAPLMVNGAEATRAIIKEGDVINIGPYLLKLTIPKEARPAPAAPPPEAPPAPAPAPAAEAVPAAEAAPQEGSAAAMDLGGLGAPGDQPADGMNLGDALQAPAEGGDPAAAQADVGSALPIGDLAGGAPAGEGLDAAAVAPGESSLQLDGVGGGGGISAPEAVETADDDAKTKLTPMAKLAVKLIFAPGTANVTEYELTKDEVSIGRGKNCDIVLNDKKSSRKNSIIRRAGLSFMIKDLDSANGTYVNGVRVQEQELAGDDLVKVGGVEFTFKAMSADYEQKAKDFMPLPAEAEPEPEPDPNALQLAGDPSGGALQGMGDPQAMPVPGGGAMDLGAVMAAGEAAAGGAVPGVAGAETHAGIPGITGIGGNTGKKKGFVEWFKSLPKNKQRIYGAIILVIFYLGVVDEDSVPVPGKKPRPKPSAVASAAPAKDEGPMTFDKLPKDQQRFVENQHNLAFEYYRNKDYDKALYEIRKIFQVINDYKDSREIERYAEEGKRRMDAIEEEKKKKEEEARLKQKIAAIVEETRDKMAKKQYDQARELFPQVLSLDPDNVNVGTWRKEIEDFEEARRLEEQQKSVQAEINKRAWDIYKEALDLKKAGKFHSAIPVFEKVADIGASDPKPNKLARKGIADCHAAIRNRRDPVLKEAKQLEDSGDLSKAYVLYEKATHIDPPHPDGYKGMRRIKMVLHDRAKVIYTEAILAESYSDFVQAKKKFKECLDMAAADDIYHDRCERKLAHYFRKDDPQQ